MATELAPASAAPDPAVRARGGGRLVSLDGLRGIAALVVLLHHVVRSFPSLGWDAPDLTFPRWSLGRLLVFSPLHLLWAGSEAVLVFFVLSGFVLGRQFADGGPVSWRRWYPGRFVRLYVPVWAVLLLGAPVVALLGAPHAGWSHFLQGRPGLNGHGLLVDATLVTGAGANAFFRGAGSVTPVLWSLQWEVLFSAALPLYLLVAREVRRPLLLAGLVLGIVAVAGNDWARFLPMFMLGVLLAIHRDAVRAWAQRFGRSSRGAWPLLAVASGLVLLAPWWVYSSKGSFASPAVLQRWLDVATAASLLGAVGFVVLALEWPAARRALSAGPCRWLGSRSFSLYLVHDPIVVAAAHAFGGVPHPAALFVVAAIALSLGAAELFHRGVERPAQRLARRLR